MLAPTPEHRLVVTTDVLVEGLDFTAKLSEPEDWGWKAVVANLSDLAAMAAEARWLVLALTVPEATPVPTLERVYAGVREACLAFEVALVGGDVSAGPALSLAVTALGRPSAPSSGREPAPGTAWPSPAPWGRPPPAWPCSSPRTRRPPSCSSGTPPGHGPPPPQPP